MEKLSREVMAKAIDTAIRLCHGGDPLSLTPEQVLDKVQWWRAYWLARTSLDSNDTRDWTYLFNTGFLGTQSQSMEEIVNEIYYELDEPGDAAQFWKVIDELKRFYS